MKVSGFSFVRNALKFDYPIVEAISSILPVCDEFIVAVGNSEDTTLDLIQSINSDKIKIIQTVWDDTLREGGKVLALETDKAFRAISSDSDWAFYIQGDEVVHEKYLDTIYNEMQKWKDNPKIEGLLFKYVHFYGSYHYIADSRKWYRNEIRIIRNQQDIFSYRDAQGFRKTPNNKLKVKPIDAYIYHYGWVREPAIQMKKQKAFHRYWSLREYVTSLSAFDYSEADSLRKFEGTQPQVMQSRVNAMNWHFEYDTKTKKYSLRVRFLMWIERLTGWRVGEYKNYKIV